ncbi:MAG: DedA family protein, partial [Bacteroidota bacterium]
TEIIDFFQFILNSEAILNQGGLWLVTLIVYVETGWFFGFFLPGDYLLFLAGLFCATTLEIPIVLMFGCIFGAAILGNFSGYFFGKAVGGRFLQRKDTWYFKKSYIENTKKFFMKYGGKALIIGRFLPIIRTFSPLFAGIAQMKLGIFSLYNVLGGLLWSSILVFGGYYLGVGFPGIIDYVHYIILFFLTITTFTVIRSYLRLRKEAKSKKTIENS